MDASESAVPRRIVLLGKSGAGRSSTGNTIFGETVFQTSDSANSETCICQTETRTVGGRGVTLIDTPGLFDINVSEEQLRPEIVRCITECSPGPHAFLIVLEKETFTSQEEEVIKKIGEYFSPEAFRHAVVLFTHGDELNPGQTIQQFVSQSKALSDLVEKCGGRCHVLDNEYWNEDEEDDYRSNQVQVAELLRTIDKIVEENKGGCYTNEKLQEVERDIQQEEENIRQSSANISQEEARKKAKHCVFKKLKIKFAAVAIGALMGFVLGVGAAVAVGGAVGGPVPLVIGGVIGAVGGALIAHDAAEGAETSREAIGKTITAIRKGPLQAVVDLTLKTTESKEEKSSDPGEEDSETNPLT